MNRIIYLAIICLVSAISCYAQCDEHSIQIIEEKKCLPNTNFVLKVSDEPYETFSWSRSSNLDDDQFLSNDDSLQVYIVGVEDTALYEVYLEVIVSENLTCLDTFQIKAVNQILPILNEVSEGLITCNQVLNESLSLDNVSNFQNLIWVFNNQTLNEFSPTLGLDELEFIQQNGLTIIGTDINGCTSDSLLFTPDFDIQYGPQQSDFVTSITIDPLQECYDINDAYNIIAQVEGVEYNFDTTFIVDNIVVAEYLQPTNINYSIDFNVNDCFVSYNYTHFHPGLSSDSVSIDFSSAGDQCSIFSFNPLEYNNENNYNSHNFYWEIFGADGGPLISSGSYNALSQNIQNVIIEGEGLYDLYIQKESLCGGLVKDTLIENFVNVIGDLEISQELEYLCVESQDNFTLNINDFSPTSSYTIENSSWSIFREDYSILGAGNNDIYSDVSSSYVQELSSSFDNVVYDFSESGDYLVTYEANVSEDCTFSDYHRFNIGVVSQFVYPISEINNYPYTYFPDLCSGLGQDISFLFESTSYLDIDDETHYDWFSQSSNVVIESPDNNEAEIIFQEIGEFDISLAVENHYGCKDTITEYVTVNNSKPNIQAAEHETGYLISDSICGPIIIDLFNVDTVSGTSYYWKIIERPISGDVSYIDTTEIVTEYLNTGTPTSNITHAFNTHAYVDIQLVVESSYSCFDTLLYENFIYVIVPMPNFTVQPNWTDPPCDSMQFDILDQSNFVDEFTFVWLGDGVYTDTYDIGYSNTVTFEFPYIDENSDESYKNYRFYIYDAIYKGCTNDFDTLVTILSRPEVNMTFLDEVCENELVNFLDASNYSSDADTSVSQFFWDFGDGNTSTSMNVTHTYSEAGNYTVSHFVSNGECVGDTIESLITVNDNPEAGYIYDSDTICYATQIKLQNNSQSTILLPVLEPFWSLSYPGEQTSYNFNDSIVYLFPETNPIVQENFPLNISLRVTDQNGCSDSITNSENFIILDSLVQTPEINYVSVTDTGIYISIEETYDDYFDFFQVHHTNTFYPNGNIDTTIYSQHIDYNNNINVINSYFLVQEDLCGNLSDNSKTHSTIILNSETNNYNTIDLDWSEYIGWDSADIAFYDIYRSINGGNFVFIDSVPAIQTFYTDSNLCNVPHEYYVNAKNINNEFISTSNKSYIQSPMFVDFMQPPYLTSTVLNNNSIKTIINSNFYNLGSWYQVDRWDVYDGWYLDYDIAYGLSFIDEDVNVSSRNYKYRVSYYDICGNEGAISNIGSNILLKGEVLATSNYYNLSWNQYKEWSDGVSEYHIQFFNSTINDFETIEVIWPTNNEIFSHDIEPMFLSRDDTSYCYRVKAFDASYSNISLSNTKCFISSARDYFPNAFTPNGDNLNDVFQFKGSNIKSLEISIFSRWGFKVFESDDIDFQWDGKNQSTGKICQEGIYVVKYKLIDYNNSIIDKLSTISIVLD